jgi:phage terminase large subunit-like protein
VIREIAFDPWNATQIVTELGGDGFVMVKFGQGYASMSAPTKELERLVNGQLSAFNRNPVMRWMAKNMSVKSDPAGNVKPDKDASAEKIDGIVAAIMGIARATASQSEAPPTEVHTA